MTDRPWMTALEMQFAAASRMRTTELPTKPGFNPALAGAVSAASRSISKHISAADTYTWSTETTSAVWLASRTVPSSSRLDPCLLPSTCGWWWFESPPGGGDTSAIAWLNCPDAVDVLVFVCNDRTPILWAHFFWTPGTSVDDFLGQAKSERPDLDWSLERNSLVVDTGRFLLAGLAWLQQRVLTTSYGHIERHRRKQLAREHNAPLPSDVKVIQLRRAESQSRPPSADSEAIEWSCRWIVNGHWRNQIYANNEHKLIYIMPFVKGPDDKPLKVPTHTVYQVNR